MEYFLPKTQSGHGGHYKYTISGSEITTWAKGGLFFTKWSVKNTSVVSDGCVIKYSIDSDGSGTAYINDAHGKTVNVYVTESVRDFVREVESESGRKIQISKL